jgi:hypothetical protein
MSIKMPKNKHGGNADPNNEAHMLAVCVKGLSRMIVEHNQQGNNQERASILLRAQALHEAQAKAHLAATRGDFAWKTAIEQGGKTIADYWDEVQVLWPPMLNHSNPSSKLSFLYYLGHNVNVFQEGCEDFHEQLRLASEAVKADDFWIINTLEDVVD